MAVPNTNTFSLTDVMNVFGLGAGGDGLIDCFNEAAVDLNFDPAYEGSKDRLSNFRNYDNGPFLTSFIGTLGDVSITTSCALTFNTTYYHNGTATTPIIGDTVYSDSGGVSILTNNYYAAFVSGSNKWFRITGSLGVVSSIGFCNGPG